MIALSQDEILGWLREKHPAQLQVLYQQANATRSKHVGDEVHLRGLIEISNHCVRHCMYCGLRAGNGNLRRYRMTQEEIVAAAQQAVVFGFGTVVLQAGEDDAITAEWIAAIVRWIKGHTSLAVTLSLGERKLKELQLWRNAGADRYLLRFETSDVNLYRMIHPNRYADALDRIELLQRIKQMGYEAGGGVMVGIPGQSYESLARDILMFAALDLDMIGIGPYIPHRDTPLGSGQLRPEIDANEHVPNSEEMVYKAIALTRILCPAANLPSTTAIATLNKSDGRRRALSVGANVVMPNLTPVQYRNLYEIYPDKACIEETASDCNSCLRSQIRSLGRLVGSGSGARPTAESNAKVGTANLVQLTA